MAALDSPVVRLIQDPSVKRREKDAPAFIPFAVGGIVDNKDAKVKPVGVRLGDDKEAKEVECRRLWTRQTANYAQ